MTLSTKRHKFGLKSKPKQQVIVELMALLEATHELDAKIELSRRIRSLVRERFPKEVRELKDITLANGLTLKVDVSDLFSAYIYFGFFNEVALLDALTASLPNHFNAIDVGANFGLYATHLAFISDSSSRVLAFEPIPHMAKLCRDNLKANKLGRRAKTEQKALGAKAGKAKFYVAGDTEFSGFHDTQRSEISSIIECDVSTIDEDKSIQALSGIDFIKIDVEGHEADVLRGGRLTLEKSTQALIMLESNTKNISPEKEQASLIEEVDYLLSRGFSGHFSGENNILIRAESGKELQACGNGTIILCGPDCGWSESFLDHLSSRAKASQKAKKFDSKGISYLLGELRSYRRMEAELAALTRRIEISDNSAKPVAGLKSYIFEIQKNLERKDAALKKLEDASSADRLQNADKDKKTGELKFKLNSANKTTEQLQSKLQQKNQELSAVNEKLKAKQDSVDGFKEIISNKDIKISKLIDQLDRVENVEAVRQYYREQIKHLNDVLSENNLSSLKLETAEQQLNISKAQINHLRDRLAQLESENADASLNALQKDADGLQIEKLKGEIDQLQQTLESERKRWIMRNDLMASRDEAYQDLLSIHESSLSQILELEKKLRDRELAALNLNDKADRLEEKNQSLTEEFSEHKAKSEGRFVELEATIESYESTLKELRAEASKNLERAQVFEAELAVQKNDYEEKVAELGLTIESKDVELKGIQNQAAQYKENIKAAKLEFDQQKTIFEEQLSGLNAALENKAADLQKAESLAELADQKIKETTEKLLAAEKSITDQGAHRIQLKEKIAKLQDEIGNFRVERDSAIEKASELRGDSERLRKARVELHGVEAELEKSRAVMSKLSQVSNSLKASRWIKIGRVFRLGPKNAALEIQQKENELDALLEAFSQRLKSVADITQTQSDDKGENKYE